MDKENYLENFEEKWNTHLGAWHPGVGVTLRGRDLFTSKKLKKSGWLGQILFSLTGRNFKSKHIKLFSEMWRLSTSYPDPRIWNNQVATLTGTARSTPYLGVGGAIAVSQAEIYGGRPFVRCFDFLLRAKKEIKLNNTPLIKIIEKELRETKQEYGYSRIYGFGRPLVTGDERIKPIRKLLKKHKSDSYVELAFRIEKIVQKKPYHLQMNVAALLSAYAADQELTVRQFSTLMTLCFTAGFLACYQDASEHQEGSFFPIRCESITPMKKNCIRKVW